ncbi:MAG: MATE family efflux transporter [bacterium]|nr:MATE family efflux transporter [bacterium]
MKKTDLSEGSVTGTLIKFALPMIAGNFLQQLYNIADTLIVGRVLGPDALAAVGSAYTLMTFLNSVLIGMCMGGGALFSYYYGKNDLPGMRQRMQTAFLFAGFFAVLISALSLLFCDGLLRLLSVPASLRGMMREYVMIIFAGIFFVFLYHYYAFVLRALGNSVVPLVFLGAASILNIGLDCLFVMTFHRGIRGAAEATLAAQVLSGVGIAFYTWKKEKRLRFTLAGMRTDKTLLKEVAGFLAAASVQQSVMNFGILMIQGLVNSFGKAVMAAFAAAVKIDTLAYMPAQEFGNAFSLFVSQNYGADRRDRVREGFSRAVRLSMGFCLVVSVVVCAAAHPLMRVFVKAKETRIIGIGAGYLRIEGACYCGIGLLFLLYGYFRGVNRPNMSLWLTIVSLGTRVALAYLLAPVAGIGVYGIWAAIPIGWALADGVGLFAMKKQQRRWKENGAFGE